MDDRRNRAEAIRGSQPPNRIEISRQLRGVYARRARIERIDSLAQLRHHRFFRAVRHRDLPEIRVQRAPVMVNAPLIVPEP
jgi:hypothetical protein